MIYLLENWKLLRAFLCPYFFLSTFLESLVVNLFFFKTFLSVGSFFTNALEIPCIIAPAWPDNPPPLTLHFTSSKIDGGDIIFQTSIELDENYNGNFQFSSS